MRSLLCTFLLWLSLGGVAVAANGDPCLPPLDDLVNARLALLDARQHKELEKEALARKSNTLIHKLVIDRLSGTYSRGRGLTVDSTVDGSSGKTLVQSDKTSSSWLLSYTLPLNALFDMNTTEAKVALEEGLLQEKRKLEQREEALKINLLYGDFLEAKTKFIDLCKPDPPGKEDQCFALVSQARKAAIGLLCMTGKALQVCSDWNGVPGKYARALKIELSCMSP